MKRRLLNNYLKFVYSIKITLLLCGSAIANTPPNILFLLTDDQTHEAVRYLGNQYIHTPNIDRLAETGTSFSRAYASFPVCLPVRAEIITGAKGFRNGIMLRYSREFDFELPTWADVLGEAGYHTWYVGKWHTPGLPSDHGYEETLGLYGSSGTRDYPTTYPVDAHGFDVTGYGNWVFMDDEGTIEPEKGVGLTPGIDALFADAAIELINRKPEKPFFLHVNFTGPHDPLLFPPGYEDMYDPDEMPLPPNYMPEPQFDYGISEIRDEKVFPIPRSPEMVRRDRAVYYAIISHIDDQIGRIVETLEQTGQLENTLIVFTSDHGLSMGSHGLRGKQNMYEHSVRVPLIFNGPGIPRGQSFDALANLRDIFPTTTDLAGARIPDTVEGHSLMPLMRGEVESVRDRNYGYFSNTPGGDMRMIQDHRWKLIHYTSLDKYQLFDIYEDPHEMRDLVNKPEHSSRVKQMANELRTWQQEVGDQLLNQ